MNIKFKNFSAVVSFTLLKIFPQKFLQAVVRFFLIAFENDEPRWIEEIC